MTASALPPVLGPLFFVAWSRVMRSSGWTPSIVPGGDDQTVYLVKDDLGRLGSVWREADAEASDLETVITVS